MSFRRRTNQSPIPDQDLPACDCGCGGVGEVVAREDVLDYLESHTTDADHLALEDCLEAQAAGDAAGALHHYRRSLHVPGLPHEVMLETLALLGSHAPPWAVGRWIVAQAWWRMLLDCDRRVDRAVRVTMASCYDVDGMDPDSFRRLGTLQVSSDRVAMDTGVHHLGGLASFVEDHVSDELAARAPDLAAWIAEPMKVYQFESISGAWATVRDVTDDRLRVVYDIHSLDGVAPGEHVLGRVVSDGGGREIFRARPVRIDSETAAQIVHSDQEGIDGLCEAWVLHVGQARAEGRLEDGFGRVPSHVLCDRTVTGEADPAIHPGLMRLMEWSTSHRSE